MVARFLQEQSPGADVGSLLMGFLDFYGNHVSLALLFPHFQSIVLHIVVALQFDPRSTGISVRKRQYFVRPNYYTSRNPGEAPMWGPMMGYQSAQLRRNSLSDKESTNIKSGRPTLYHNSHVTQQQPMSAQVPYQHALPDERNSFDNGMPYTFDPLFIEDPLSA
jgi:Cid1 family poly A polymerase